MIDVDGLLDLDDLWSLYEVEGHRELRDPPWTPVTQPAWPTPTTARPTCSPPCARATCCVHHPYDSFATSVERLVQQAVADPTCSRSR